MFEILARIVVVILLIDLCLTGYEQHRPKDPTANTRGVRWRVAAALGTSLTVLWMVGAHSLPSFF